MTITRIERAAWAVVWDKAAGRHVYARDTDIVFDADRIVHIGPNYHGRVDETIHGASAFVIPGLVNVHSHLLSENLGRGITEEVGNPALYMSGLYDPKPLFLVGHAMEFGADQVDGFRAGTRMAIAELLVSGVTTVVDLGMPFEGWLDVLAETGIRAFAAPMYRSARWVVRTGHAVDYEWDEPAARRAFATALATVDAARSHPSGRISAVISPAQVDTCTPELLADSLAAAKERDLKLTLHCGQSVWEFQEMTRRHGRTPVQWLADIGLLGPRTLLGHALMVDSHSWVHWPTREDIGLLAGTGTSVAHCPTVFSRYGQTMEHLGAYIRAGVNVGIGTDTQPHNMIEEMRTALILARVAAENVEAITAGEVFHAATVGGARALGREDLGRLAVGAKADLVVVDLSNPAMRPVRDPLRSLIFTAADRAVARVYVDGRLVVKDGEVLTIERDDAATRLAAAQGRALALAPQRDYARRPIERIAPLTLPLA
ncbi:MAG: amidohydrolase family protein [Pseudomonadota bacterium]